VSSQSSMTTNAESTKSDCATEERDLRIDLAAAFRLTVKFDWHESIANHFSAAISDDGKTFLLNPRWKHFSTIKATELLSLHADDESVMDQPDAPDPSAWCIHGAIHAAVPHARVLLHCHPPYATALCGLEDPAIKPIDQNTARFFNRLAIAALGNHSIMMMGNHGVSVVGETVAEAFEHLYHRAGRNIQTRLSHTLSSLKKFSMKQMTLIDTK